MQKPGPFGTETMFRGEYGNGSRKVNVCLNDWVVGGTSEDRRLSEETNGVTHPVYDSKR